MSALVEILKEIESKLLSIKANNLEKRFPSELFDMLKARDEHRRIGSKLFYDFYKLGCQAFSSGISSFKEDNQLLHQHATIVGQLIVDTKLFLYRYLFIFPNFVTIIDEYCCVEVQQCQLRSGIQFMFDLFIDIGNESLDLTIKRMKHRHLYYIDGKINFAKMMNKFRVSKDDIPSLPDSHTWWYP